MGGIAGLRVGYAIGSELIIDHLMTIKQPYNLNIAAESAALAALEHKEILMARIDTLDQRTQTGRSGVRRVGRYQLLAIDCELSVDEIR